MSRLKTHSRLAADIEMQCRYIEDLAEGVESKTQMSERCLC